MNLEQAVRDPFASSLVEPTTRGARLVARSLFEDGFKKIKAEGTLITNAPESVRLGELLGEWSAESSGGVRWERVRRVVDVLEPPDGAFILYRAFHTIDSWGCITREIHVNLVGEAPPLSFNEVFDEWAGPFKDEAFDFLAARIPQRHMRKLYYADGRIHRGASYHNRLLAWGVIARALGVQLHKVRLWSMPAYLALQVGWVPPVPPPERWEGLPAGVVEINLEQRDGDE